MTILTLGVNFINVKRTNFSYEHRFGSFYYVHVTRKKLPIQHSYKKFAHLMLMKLTLGGEAKESVSKKDILAGQNRKLKNKDFGKSFFLYFMVFSD